MKFFKIYMMWVSVCIWNICGWHSSFIYLSNIVSLYCWMTTFMNLTTWFWMQQFHEWLSNKARPKPRSPSWSSQEEDLAQRLEAKLSAAEQKRYIYIFLLRSVHNSFNSLLPFFIFSIARVMLCAWESFIMTIIFGFIYCSSCLFMYLRLIFPILVARLIFSIQNKVVLYWDMLPWK